MQLWVRDTHTAGELDYAHLNYTDRTCTGAKKTEAVAHLTNLEQHTTLKFKNDREGA